MSQKPVVSTSVRNLVEYVLLSGSIHSGFAPVSRLHEGSRAHREIQSRQPEGYRPEVPVSWCMERESFTLEVTGRIDGLVESEEGILIDEIKSVSGPLEDVSEESNPQYWAQAKCYGYMYAVAAGKNYIEIQLTYVQLDTRDTCLFLKSYSLEELQDYFLQMVEQYLVWMEQVQEWIEKRNHSIASLAFPFQGYRKGQRELAVAVYKTIREGEKLFAQAPTGTGKTMAALFPAVKSLGDGTVIKIFYLTAKTVTRTIAEKALEQMRETGLRLKSVTITAKEKICCNEEMKCDPLFCPYADGYYDRIKEAITDVFRRQDAISREVLEEYGRKHQVCPFELSLDLASWCDCVICDYNYVYDPRVYLKRFFAAGGGDYAFLVDEAHNLVDRAREMFSADLSKREILDVKKMTKRSLPDISRVLNKLNTALVEYRKKCEEERGYMVSPEAPADLLPHLRELVQLCELWLPRDMEAALREPLIELYFRAVMFLKISELYDERYVTYCEKLDQELYIKLFCVDPGKLLKEASRRGRSTILFSATLSPLEYFIRILGGEEHSYRMRLSSPFDPQNLCVMLDTSISTRYKTRHFTYDRIAASIRTVVEAKKGNYMVFFPSYRYMEDTWSSFAALEAPVEVMKQSSGMTEEDREAFLHAFTLPRENSLVAFTVMGGVFGEGIDLTGDLLTGAIIVGVGLPQVCLEKDIIRQHFDEREGDGFAYAYIYPGMTKVLQAVGRVIRTETDRGVVLLMDDRFDRQPYRALCPPEWNPIRRLYNGTDTSTYIQKFWEKDK